MARLCWLACAGLAVAVGFVLLTQLVGAPPRTLAAQLERRSQGHGAGIEAWGRALSAWLTGLDRAAGKPPMPWPWRLRVQAAQPRPGRPVPVASPEQLRQAIEQARPGDVISLAAGVYRLRGPAIAATQPGRDDAPVVVRAEPAGSVRLELAMTEGFVVSAPHWQFEGLTLRGTCQRHADCEHAFHVVGGATHFVARNNTLVDFNAHFKINNEGSSAPDRGLIEGNTLSNTAARDTDSPVVAIDLVGASQWVIRANVISDIVQAGGQRISYGAYAKGAGAHNRFERNIVVCEQRLRGLPGQRVGLSLGGGGTAPQYCRDQRCVTEQDQGLIESNLIAACSDDGIHLNRASASRILHNTLIDTGGITVRYPESSAEAQANLVDGPIRSRDGGVLHASGNLDTPPWRLYLGWHPVRALFADAAGLDLTWQASPPRSASTGSDNTADLCGKLRRQDAALGAFDDYSACLRSAIEVDGANGR